MAKSLELTTIACPSCGRWREVSARTARRGAGRCRWCISGDGVIPEPDDETRRWWLQRFTDEELCEIVAWTFGRLPDRAHIRSERERLLGRVVAAA